MKNVKKTPTIEAYDLT